MLIGVPVAATPGLVPQDDVLVETAAALVVALAVVLALALDEAVVEVLALLLLLLLLPQPAKNIRPTVASNAKLGRTRDPWW
jgi:hypothetical protein